MASTKRMPDRTGPGGRRKPTVWRARYRDEAGKEHARHFTRRADAQRWLDEVTAALVTGQHVDPNAGRVTSAAYFEEWATRQVWESTTDLAMRLAARSVTFADVPLARLRRSHLEGWVKAMSVAGLAPGTIRTRTNNVRAVLRGAVRDRVMASDPSDGLALPRDRRREAAMALPGPDQVAAVLDAAAPPSQALVAVAAFAGLRLGEAAALQVGDLDPLRRRLHVRRQVQRAGGSAVEVRLRCGGPSTAVSGRSSRRTPCSSCWQSTWRGTIRATTRRAGCSRRRPVNRPTITPSATTGGRTATALACRA